MAVMDAAGQSRGTRLRDTLDDDEDGDDEPVSVAANTSLPKADSLKDDSSGSSGSSGPSQSVESPDRRLGREVGSADLSISLDDQGRAQETLSGMGSGGANSTQGVTTEDTTEVATVTADESIADAENTEQRVENATDGRAYGDPNETENIGTGDAVTTTTSDGSTSPTSPSELLDGLPVDALVVGAVALVGLAVAAGGDA
ncbi:hypothetical protein [Haloarchaeobius salinus]|uniref:hypothetical protein n=1 Tax=Haloarchaeobius salinus TaxID=1198298 RepID=UPI00210A1F7B|nr:hypothetical protein [Haloarchaeobius salinus]